MDTEKVVDKIKKLLRLQRNAEQINSKGEAYAAARTIKRLLTEYNLSLESISEEEQGTYNPEIKEGIIGSYGSRYGTQWKTLLIQVIAHYNFCKAGTNRPTKHLFVIGTEENVAAVKIFYDYLSKAFQQLAKKSFDGYMSGLIDKNEKLKAYAKEIKELLKNTEETEYVRSYLVGCVSGLAEQFEEMRKNQSTQETALAIRHEDLIDDFAASNNIQDARPMKIKRGNSQYALYAGYMAGKEISLNQQIDSSHTKRLKR